MVVELKTNTLHRVIHREDRLAFQTLNTTDWRLTGDETDKFKTRVVRIAESGKGTAIETTGGRRTWAKLFSDST
jgi:hypothetical protein